MKPHWPADREAIEIAGPGGPFPAACDDFQAKPSTKGGQSSADDGGAARNFPGNLSTMTASNGSEQRDIVKNGHAKARTDQRG